MTPPLQYVGFSPRWCSSTSRTEKDVWEWGLVSRLCPTPPTLAGPNRGHAFIMCVCKCVSVDVCVCDGVSTCTSWGVVSRSCHFCPIPPTYARLCCGHTLTPTHRSISKANQIHQVCLQHSSPFVNLVAGAPLLAAPDPKPGIAHFVSSDCRTCYGYQFNLLILQQHAMLQFVGYFLNLWKHLVESRQRSRDHAMMNGPQ